MRRSRKRDCPDCNGSGEIRWNPSPIGDPQCEEWAPCGRCGGFGAINEKEGGMRPLKIGALVVPYLAAVVAANLIVNHYGPTSTPYVAFGLIGAVLIFRDRFADLVGPRRVLAQAALIGVGAVLTFLVNRNAAVIAEASVIAFAASEAIEGTLYFAIRKRPWLERAPLSATAGAAVDSVLFISIAFGFSLPIAFAQFVAKVAGAYLWARLIQGVRGQREVLPRNA